MRQALYLEAMFGITVTGVIMGSSVLHGKSAMGMYAFGPNREVTGIMELLITRSPAVHAFVKNSILCEYLLLIYASDPD